MIKKEFQITKILTLSQENQINHLWNIEYPSKLNNRFLLLLKDVSKYTHYIVEDENQNIIAWAMDFEKDNEIRFSIIVDSNYKGQGLGKLLIDQLKIEHAEFYGWVIDHENDLKENGQVYESPIPFYLKQGFKILPDCRLDTELIKAVKIAWTTK
jgi:hypothetical protein